LIILTQAYAKADIPHLERREETRKGLIGHLSLAMTYVMIEMTYVMLI